MENRPDADDTDDPNDSENREPYTGGEEQNRVIMRGPQGPQGNRFSYNGFMPDDQSEAWVLVPQENGTTQIRDRSEVRYVPSTPTSTPRRNETRWSSDSGPPPEVMRVIEDPPTGRRASSSDAFQIPQSFGIENRRPNRRLDMDGTHVLSRQNVFNARLESRSTGNLTGDIQTQRNHHSGANMPMSHNMYENRPGMSGSMYRGSPQFGGGMSLTELYKASLRKSLPPPKMIQPTKVPKKRVHGLVKLVIKEGEFNLETGTIRARRGTGIPFQLEKRMSLDEADNTIRQVLGCRVGEGLFLEHIDGTDIIITDQMSIQNKLAIVGFVVHSISLGELVNTMLFKRVTVYGSSGMHLLVKRTYPPDDEKDDGDFDEDGRCATPVPVTPNEGRGGTPAPDTPNEERGGTPAPDTPNEGRGGTPAPDTPNEERGGTPAPDTPNQGRGTTPAPVTPNEGRGATPARDTPNEGRGATPTRDTPSERRGATPSQDTPNDNRRGQTSNGGVNTEERIAEWEDISVEGRNGDVENIDDYPPEIEDILERHAADILISNVPSNEENGILNDSDDSLPEIIQVVQDDKFDPHYNGQEGSDGHSCNIQHLQAIFVRPRGRRGVVRVVIRRNEFLMSVYEAHINLKRNGQLGKIIEIVFEDEPGRDFGGLSREFLTILIEKSKEAEVIVGDEEVGFTFPPKYHLVKEIEAISYFIFKMGITILPLFPPIVISIITQKKLPENKMQWASAFRAYPSVIGSETLFNLKLMDSFGIEKLKTEDPEVYLSLKVECGMALGIQHLEAGMEVEIISNLFQYEICSKMLWLFNAIRTGVSQSDFLSFVEEHPSALAIYSIEMKEFMVTSAEAIMDKCIFADTRDVDEEDVKKARKFLKNTLKALEGGLIFESESGPAKLDLGTFCTFATASSNLMGVGIEVDFTREHNLFFAAATCPRQITIPLGLDEDMFFRCLFEKLSYPGFTSA